VRRTGFPSEQWQTGRIRPGRSARTPPGESQLAPAICKVPADLKPTPSSDSERRELHPVTAVIEPDLPGAAAALTDDAGERRRQLPKRKTWRPASELAVDLGTANTLVLVKGEGVVLNEPSVAAVDQATGNILGIGLEAKRMLGRTPDGILAVRPMKDGVIANFDVAEKMLRHFLRLVIDRTILKVKPSVIVCVPSGITEVERRAVRDSARSAGVKRLLMVAEPMAAAIGVGLPVETPVGNMVIDIGGGTTNIAVIALSGIVCDASIRTGGDELDQSIVQFMRKTYSLLIGEPTAERIKIRIGSAVPLLPETEMDVKGRDLVSGLPKTVRIDSAGVRDAIQEPLSRIVNAVRRALEMTPPELASDILERGIILTGGGALIRGLDQLLIDETGLPVRVDDDPLTSVVRGTGRILDDYARYGSVLTT
jgi:rod shape-determining protein MreB and related proteins